MHHGFDQNPPSGIGSKVMDKTTLAKGPIRSTNKKNSNRMTELATKLQAKIKTYKKQIEEAEEIAALNLAKFRKAQQEFEETEERARIAGARIHL